MTFLKSLLTALISTVVTTLLYALFQVSLFEDNAETVTGLFVFYLFYIASVYFIIILPFSLIVFSKINSYSKRFLTFSLLGIIIGSLLSLYIHSDLPFFDAGRIYSIYISISFIAVNIYLLIYFFISKIIKKDK